jgi:hypothetical protein
MELDPKFFWGSMCTAVLIGPAIPPISPRIWAHIQGRYWSAKIDEISLSPSALQAARSSFFTITSS